MQRTSAQCSYVNPRQLFQLIVYKSSLKKKKQILLASAPVLATVSAGFTTGYSAIFLEQLQSNATTIKITRDEASWIASLAAFGMEIWVEQKKCLFSPFNFRPTAAEFAFARIVNMFFDCS